MKITLRKKSQTGYLVGFLLVFPFFFGTLNNLLGLPWSIRYAMDAVWLVLFLIMFTYRERIQWKNTKRLAVWITLFFIYTAVWYLPQFQSALYYLWGVRNNFRFYAAFFAFAIFLSAQDVEDYFKLFDKLFWINLIVSLVQFFVLGKKGDLLGGLFGVETGANGYTNNFFCIILIKSIVFYLCKKEKLWSCVLKFVAAIIVAALAELKFFFIEAIIIIVLAVLFTNFSWRKVLIMVGGLAGIFAGAVLLVQIFPNFTGFFSWEWMWENAVSDKGYTSSGDINRLNAIAVINERFLENGWDQLFGLGLGNCDTSTVSLLNTPFYEEYGWLHYSWLSYAMMYLECGWIGLIFYFGFFVIVYSRILKIERGAEAAQKNYCRIARIMVILCAVIAIYNSSLRTEAAYMTYFVLAVPFALHKQSSI